MCRVTDDRGEFDDQAAQNPQKVREMEEKWER
jgi:hypothetical protein